MGFEFGSSFLFEKKIVSFLWLKWGVGGRNFLNKASWLVERECPTFSVLTPPWTGRPLWVRLINFRPTREINQNPDKWNRPTFDLKFYNFPKPTVMNRNYKQLLIYKVSLEWFLSEKILIFIFCSLKSDQKILDSEFLLMKITILIKNWLTTRRL